MKKTTAARTQRKSDEGPLAAASAIQRMPRIAATLKRTMSFVRSARSSAMRKLSLASLQPFDEVEVRRGGAAVAVSVGLSVRGQKDGPDLDDPGPLWRGEVLPVFP